MSKGKIAYVTKEQFIELNEKAIKLKKNRSIERYEYDSISDAKFGFKFAKSVMTDISFNEGDMMMLDVSVKAVGTGIGSGAALFEIGC